MAVRFYVVPKIGTGPLSDPFRPKYVSALGVAFSAMDYGLEDTVLVGADVTTTQHTALAANADVIVVPANLDNLITAGALSAVRDALELLHVPAGWVTTSHTYRDVIRLVGKLFIYMQRFRGRQVQKFFQSGVTLGTLVSELTGAQRTAMQTAAESLGLDTGGITGGMTIRQVLEVLCDQMPSFALAGEVF